jgi:hypothetical protein
MTNCRSFCTPYSYMHLLSLTQYLYAMVHSFFTHTSVSWFSGRTLWFRCGTEETHACKIICTRYYCAQFMPILNPTFSTISLKLLKYTLKQKINHNFYIYIYIYIYTHNTVLLWTLLHTRNQTYPAPIQDL